MNREVGYKQSSLCTIPKICSLVYDSAEMLIKSLICRWTKKIDSKNSSTMLYGAKERY